jgi:hypothetical protein
MSDIKLVSDVFWNNGDFEQLESLKRKVNEQHGVIYDDNEFYNDMYESRIEDVEFVFKSMGVVFPVDFSFIYDRLNTILRYFNHEYELYSLKEINNNILKLAFSSLLIEISMKFDEVNETIEDMAMDLEEKEQFILNKLN